MTYHSIRTMTAVCDNCGHQEEIEYLDPGLATRFNSMERAAIKKEWIISPIYKLVGDTHTVIGRINLCAKECAPKAKQITKEKGSSL